ncbi:hypothetical protein LEP1GSC178_1611 [Leptospira licerasiae str. MMD4847]|uniref:Uncharacterized protein n=1 Tax=Leptospira licerasiae str. MMD4847 TaxID=1049971 RepID=A0ABN0H563_9LEPT|nr:hypothetical protein LEP1GSC178_1611 [Leptospira licerasiae str. MMD4847]
MYLRNNLANRLKRFWQRTSVRNQFLKYKCPNSSSLQRKL